MFGPVECFGLGGDSKSVLKNQDIWCLMERKYTKMGTRLRQSKINKQIKIELLFWNTSLMWCWKVLLTLILKLGRWNTLVCVTIIRLNAELWFAGNQRLAIKPYVSTKHLTTKHKEDKSREERTKLILKVGPWHLESVGSSYPGFTTSIFWWQPCTCWSPGRGRCSVSFFRVEVASEGMYYRANLLPLAER